MRPFGVTHLAYLLGFGLLGWAALVVASVLPLEPFVPWRPSWQLAGCFALVAAARLLSSQVYRRVFIALDSAFYIAARFVFGSVPAAWMAALLLTLDDSIRQARGSGPLMKGEAPIRFALAHVAFNGGLPALAMLGTGALFGDAELYADTDAALAWTLPLFGLCFLFLHYAVAAGATYLLRPESGNTARQVFQRAVGAEATLLPLSLAMALAYKHQGIGLFLLIGGVGLIFNVIFRRMTSFSRKLKSRVVELEVLNRVARIIAGSLDRKTLFQNLATTTLQLVGDTSRFMIGLEDERGDSVAYELFNKDGECYKQLVAPRGEGLSGWVMRQRQGLILGDVQAQYGLYVKDERYNDPRFHSWLAVPLIVYDDVVGVMSVQTERRHAYTMDHLRVLTMIADQAAVAIENSRLYQLATVDGLTGLFVRRYFDQRIVEEWDRSARYGNAFTLGLFDLDNFKKLNDTQGHQVGDQVLRAAARAVKSNMRSFDLAARYGGEEFAFILPRTGLDDAVAVAERIRQDVAAAVVSGAKAPVRVTASIGLAVYPAEGISTASELVARADQALYQAKAAGRNRVVTWGAAAAAERSVSEAVT